MDVSLITPPVDWLPYAKPTGTTFRGVIVADWLRRAYQNAAQFSKDPSTQTGSVLIGFYADTKEPWIIGEGANFFPKGVRETPERWDRSVKLQFIEHAERNCIYAAARRGNRTEGSVMFCPWYACTDCARAIIEARVKTVIGHKACYDKTPERWRSSIQTAFEMLEEAGVECLVWNGEIGGVTIRFNGEEWNP